MCYSQKTSEAINKKLAVPVGVYILFFIKLPVWVSQETCSFFTAIREVALWHKTKSYLFCNINQYG